MILTQKSPNLIDSLATMNSVLLGPGSLIRERQILSDKPVGSLVLPSGLERLCTCQNFTSQDFLREIYWSPEEPKTNLERPPKEEKDSKNLPVTK